MPPGLQPARHLGLVQLVYPDQEPVDPHSEPRLTALDGSSPTGRCPRAGERSRERERVGAVLTDAADADDRQ